MFAEGSCVMLAQSELICRSHCGTAGSPQGLMALGSSGKTDVAMQRLIAESVVLST